MKTKVLLVRCPGCQRITAAWMCEPGAEDAIGSTIVNAAQRGADIAIIDCPDGGVRLEGCNCSESTPLLPA